MTGPVEMAERAADELQGSCRSLADLGPEFEALEDNMTFCATLDQLVFCCTGCNWWFENSEMADDADWKCEECGAD